MVLTKQGGRTMSVLTFCYVAVFLPVQINYILVGQPMATPSDDYYPGAKLVGRVQALSEKPP